MSERSEADFPVSSGPLVTRDEIVTQTSPTLSDQMSTAAHTTTTTVSPAAGASPKITGKPGAVPTKPPGPWLKSKYQTAVVQTGIEAKEFIQVILPTLPKGETVRAVGARAAVVTATSETVLIVQKIAEQLVQSLDSTTSGVTARGALLSDSTEESSRTYSREHVAEILKNYGVTSSDADSLTIPDEMVKLCDFAFPVSAGGETRMALTEHMDLHLRTEMRATGVFSSKATLTQKDKGVNPFDTGAPGRIILMNDFDIAVGQAVVLGVTRPGRSLMLLIQLSKAGEPPPAEPSPGKAL